MNCDADRLWKRPLYIAEDDVVNGRNQLQERYYQESPLTADDAETGKHSSPLLYKLLMFDKLYSCDTDPPKHGLDSVVGNRNESFLEENIYAETECKPLDLTIRKPNDLKDTSNKDGKNLPQKASIYNSIARLEDSYGKDMVTIGHEEKETEESEIPSGLMLLSKCSELRDSRGVVAEHADSSEAVCGHEKRGLIEEFILKKINDYRVKNDKALFKKPKSFHTVSLEETKIKNKMAKLKKKYQKIRKKLRRLEETDKLLICQNVKPNMQIPVTASGSNGAQTEDNICDDEIPKVERASYPMCNFEKVEKHEDDIKENGQAPKKETDIEDCCLSNSDLKDGLRVLLEKEGVFHPGRLSCILPPDIYGVKIDKDRGHKPHLFPREEILKKAIRDEKPEKTTELPIGCRVCVLWSSKMSFLHPGVVTGYDLDEEYVFVQLDDGDCRDVHITQIRYLPQNIPQPIPKQGEFVR